MTDKTKAEARLAGRPRIDDALPVYLYVEAGRRRTNKSVYAFTETQKVQFVRLVDQTSTKLQCIKKESLRRRYTDAQRQLRPQPNTHEFIAKYGIVLHPERTLDNKLPDDASDPAFSMATETIERMLTDLA